MIVIEGKKKEIKVFTDEMISSRLKDCLEKGMKKTEAVKFVAEETGISKNRIYDLSIR